jgi:hypothetical protein
MPEWAPFAAMLARRLSGMLAKGLVVPKSELWDMALDHILLRAVDTETQVWCNECASCQSRVLAQEGVLRDGLLVFVVAVVGRCDDLSSWHA